MTANTSVASIVEDLRALGVRAGDVVMVHASLKRIGPVVGGAAGVLAALDRALGPEGTVLMVLGATNPRAWVNERPEGERTRLLVGAEPFDAATTRADPDVGMLAEVLRREPGTQVSDHPEGRFGARGRLAHELVEQVPWDDYYGPGSPLERLVGHGGKVLRLGADLDTVTLLHLAEYLADVPRKRRVRRRRLVATPAGPQVRVVDCLDDSRGIVDRPGEEDYFATITREYVATRPVRTGRVGRARAELIDAADLVAFGTAWMSEHLRAPGAAAGSC